MQFAMLGQILEEIIVKPYSYTSLSASNPSGSIISRTEPFLI